MKFDGTSTKEERKAYMEKGLADSRKIITDCLNDAKRDLANTTEDSPLRKFLVNSVARWERALVLNDRRAEEQRAKFEENSKELENDLRELSRESQERLAAIDAHYEEKRRERQKERDIADRAREEFRASQKRAQEHRTQVTLSILGLLGIAALSHYFKGAK